MHHCHLLLPLLLLLLLLLPLTPALEPERCAPEGSLFHDYCRCAIPGSDCPIGSLEFSCNRLPQIFNESTIKTNVSCLLISNSPLLKRLQGNDLKQFPNLQTLIIMNSPLNEIVPQSLDHLQQLSHLKLHRNELTVVPHITLPDLITFIITNNRISKIDNNSTFVGLPTLTSFDASYNDIHELRGSPFHSNCILTELKLEGNPLRVLADEVFEGTHITLLDLSGTELSYVPSPMYLRERLTKLFLNKTYNLKEFSISNGPDDRYSNKTFPFLQHVVFPYHAHCCQLRSLGYRYNVFNGSRVKRYVMDAAYTLLYGISGSEDRVKRSSEDKVKRVSEDRVKQGSEDRVKRGSEDRIDDDVITMCVNHTSLDCLEVGVVSMLNMNVSEYDDITLFDDVTSFCSSFNSCISCLEEVCLELCATPLANESTIPLSSPSNQLSCLLEQESSMPSLSISPTQTISPTSASSSLATQQSVSMTTPYMPISSSSLDFITSSSLILNMETFTTLVYHTLCPSPTIEATPLPKTSPLIEATPLPDACNVTEIEAVCIRTFDPSVTMATTMATTEPPTTDCTCPMGDFDCIVCLRQCSTPFCMAAYSDLCLCLSSRKKRALSQGNKNLHGNDNQREEGYPHDDHHHLTQGDPTIPHISHQLGKRSDDDDEDVFFVFDDNSSTPLSCRPVAITMTPITMTPVQCPVVIDLQSTIEVAETVCLPESTVFNPCDDLLGNQDFLRVAIWFVIFLSLAGNGLVFVVFVGYTLILRRTKQDLFIIHFMYFNLAMADMIMGVYLLIIAIVDASTVDNFFRTDISWRTGHGCGFAGFCAITSTVVSVYVLLVITLERTYTIVNVFSHKKLTKAKAALLMLVGWGIGLLVAMLPLLGVSDYESVSICLPFNVEGPEDQAYVISLLIATGLIFIIIAICYSIIFQQIFCNRNKKRPHQDDMKQFYGDVKIAIRIFILIFTNFICWFPIALVGIAAAAGYPLGGNGLAFARVAMVFVFPFNSCLNPILYSLTTKAFRDNFILLCNQCGLCKEEARRVKNSRVGVIPSYTSRGSETSGISQGRGTIIERLRSLSISSASSTSNLLGKGRRSSGISQEMDERRRNSALSSGSSEEILGRGSRRGSTLSGESGDENGGSMFSNPAYCSSSPTTGSNSAPSGSGITMGTMDVLRVKNKISISSLGALPEEEIEMPMDVVVGDLDVIKVNPTFCETEEEGGESYVTMEKGEGQEGEGQRDSGVLEGSEYGIVLVNYSSSSEDHNVPKPDSDIDSGSG